MRGFVGPSRTDRELEHDGVIGREGVEGPLLDLDADVRDARVGRGAELAVRGGREGSRLRGGLQKLAKSLCPACEGAVLDASSEEIALTPAIESRDCDYGGHNQLRIRFGHVLIHDLLDTI